MLLLFGFSSLFFYLFQEQLDHSMKYERRSVLDKSELLVDVRLPKLGIDDDEQEEEYLKSFKFDEDEGRDMLEKLNDGEDDDDDTDDYIAGETVPDVEEEVWIYFSLFFFSKGFS